MAEVAEDVKKLAVIYAARARVGAWGLQETIANVILADRLTRQDPDIRRAALEERKDRERQIRVSEYRRAVEFLHKQADRMNDLHARAVLNLAADDLGRARSRDLKEAGR